MIFKEESMIKFVHDEVEETLKGGVKKEDNLKTAKEKMDEVKEENQRLKSTLFQMMKDYQSLKMKISNTFQEDSAPVSASNDESELVSLSLGRSFSSELKKNNRDQSKRDRGEKDHRLDGLELGLDCKFHDWNNPTPGNSSDESLKEEEKDEKRVNDKSLKTRSVTELDEILQQNPLKKPRVSVRALCNTQTMNDGCQWRKYGQKISKGNPCPRGYYRCTVSTSCPVRKQVQRCADDMSILITTYEGTHNHPLPPSATKMASATTAAVAMLNCGSSTSSSSAANPNLLGFNFSSSNNLNTPYFPKTSISTSQSHPTITLDLTTPNHTSSSYNKFSSSTLFSSTHSSSNSLDFSTSNLSFDHPKPHNINNLRSPYSQSIYNNIIGASQEKTMNDKIANATKAITFDPTFQSALAAAITSFVGTSDQGRNLGLNFLKRDDNFHLSFSQHEKQLMHCPPFTFYTSEPSLADKGEQVNL